MDFSKSPFFLLLNIENLGNNLPSRNIDNYIKIFFKNNPFFDNSPAKNLEHSKKFKDLWPWGWFGKYP